MEITEVKVFPINEEKLKAFVSVVFDRCFMVNDIKIIHGRDGLFISMPSRKKKNGEFKDVAHPLNNDTRQMIELRVVEEYERVLGERGEELPAPARAYPGNDGGKDEKGTDDGADRPQARRPPKPEAEPQDEPEAQDEPANQDEEPAAPAETEAPPMAAAGGDEAPAAIEEPGTEASSDEEDGKEDKGKSLEEVQERHLRDSFWSVS